MDPNQYLRMRNLFGIDPNNPIQQMPQPMDEIPRPNIPNGQMQPSGMPPPYSGPTVPPAHPLGPMTTLPNGGQLPQIAASQANSNQDQQPDMATRFNQLYQPEHTAIDKYTKLLDEYPNPNAKENRPPWWRAAIGGLQAIASGMAPGRGASWDTFNPEGNKAAMDYVNAPYTNKLIQWKQLTGATKDAANIERQGNVNARTGANAILSQELKERDITRKEEADRNRLTIQQGNQRLALMKQQMPNYVFDNTGPTVTARDRTTGKVVDTGFPTHQLDPLTKLYIEQEGDMAQIAARGANAMDVAEANIKGRQDIVETRGWKPFEETMPDGSKRVFMYNEATGEQRDRIAGSKTDSATPVRKSGSTTVGKPETAQNKRVREYTNARDLRNSRPDLRNFIKLKGSNEFEITPPGKNWFGSPTGPNQGQFEEINELIKKGEPTPVTPMTSRSAAPIAPPVSQQPTQSLAPSHAPPNKPAQMPTTSRTMMPSHGSPKNVTIPGRNIEMPGQLNIPEGMVPIYNPNGTIAKLVPANQAGTASSVPSKYVVTVE